MESDAFQKFEEDVKLILSLHDIYIAGIEISPDNGGYIDHQSLDYYNNDINGMYYIFKKDEITLEEYVFNKNIRLFISNDNNY